MTCSRHYCLALVGCMLCVASQSRAAARAQAAKVVPSWTLATADTIVKVSVAHGRAVLDLLASNTDKRNWLNNPLQEELMQAVEIDGKARQTDWKFRDAHFDGKQLTLRFENS